MEKISNIVRSSSRVASVDLKGSAPIRSGTPSFGRPVMESSSVRGGVGTTADRAVAIHNEMTEAKKVMSSDRTISNLADQFFMSRVRRPEEQQVQGPPSVDDVVTPVPVDALATLPSEELAEATAYTPRGSYVDVRA